MTKDKMIKLAIEAGWQYADGDDGYSPLWRFAALVVAAERERFASECIDIVAMHGGSVEIEAAIRARGEK